MGAAFESLIPNGDVRLSYHGVHKYRRYLMRMLGEDVLVQYLKIMEDLRMTSTQKELEDVDKRYTEFMLSLNGDHAFGIRSFVDHSDCDGDFSSEQCEYIAKAFYALLDTDIVTDEDDRDTVRELAELFESTADNDGVVMIW